MLNELLVLLGVGVILALIIFIVYYLKQKNSLEVVDEGVK